jgi:hypothetical protein
MWLRGENFMTRKTYLVLLIVALLVAMTAALAMAQEPAMVSVGHGIPGDDVGQPDPALPVDVIVDGACFLQDFEFGDFAGPVELPAGTYSVAIALSDEDPDLCGGTVVIGPVDLTFEEGDNVTVFAHLTGDGLPGPAGVDVLGLGITATVFDNDVSNVIAGYGRVTVRHTAWAPAVDIDINRGWYRGRLVAGIEDLENPNQSEPLDTRPGAYAVSIFPADSDEAVFEVHPFVTRPHLSQIAYAVGSLENETFTLIVQTLDLGITPPGRPLPPG